MLKGNKKYAFILVTLFVAAIPLGVSAQDKLAVSAETSATSCDVVDFSFQVEGGSAPYSLYMEFGDGESASQLDVSESVIETSHIYPSQGDWAWTASIQDGAGLGGQVAGTVSLEGPSVSLTSDPFPPLLTLDADQVSVEFIADASAGIAPDAFSWDLDSDGNPDAGLEGSKVSKSYTEAGSYSAAVTVTDGCGFTASDSLPVVVIDPEDEDSCHPTAQKIADAVNSIFPDQAQSLYTCEDIFDIFEGALFGTQVGFGRMWHAYQLTQTIDDLTWEEIRDWHLNEGGWGLLVQLDRFSDSLETYGVRELMELVMSGEQSVGEIRTAMRSVLRYEADFDDALQRINDGANSGELNQFYRLTSELQIEPALLDSYMADGMTLPELRHAANFADRVGADWMEIAEAKAFDHSWGELGQAYRLADEDSSAADILAMGVQAFRSQQREEAQAERKGERAGRTEEQTQRTADRLAEQFGVDNAVVDSQFEACEGNWGCVRKALREQEQTSAASSQHERTAAQIASKYGVSQSEVMNYYENSCGQDWNCVRAHYRDLNKNNQGKGKNK